MHQVYLSKDFLNRGDFRTNLRKIEYPSFRPLYFDKSTGVVLKLFYIKIMNINFYLLNLTADRFLVSLQFEIYRLNFLQIIVADLFHYNCGNLGNSNDFQESFAEILMVHLMC